MTIHPSSTTRQVLDAYLTPDDVVISHLTPEEKAQIYRLNKEDPSKWNAKAVAQQWVLDDDLSTL